MLLTTILFFGQTLLVFLDGWLDLLKLKLSQPPMTPGVELKSFFGVYLSYLTTLLFTRMQFYGQKLLVWVGGWVAGWVAGFSGNIAISAPN